MPVLLVTFGLFMLVLTVSLALTCRRELQSNQPMCYDNYKFHSIGLPQRFSGERNLMVQGSDEELINIPELIERTKSSSSELNKQ
ncbi:hypothetical protein FGIG_06737 [Fasciola gigantica]|uniref:Uncharacterized protein n=1 Tax=Fasciola gigantica TaxID=46835 RepID=A0A504YNA7_FASGI|nr:hypothetical protein FGIG_06737 [Fasciola gigantica]